MRKLVTLSILSLLFLATSCQKESLTEFTPVVENEMLPIQPLTEINNFETDETFEEMEEEETNTSNSSSELTLLQYLKSKNHFSEFYQAVSITGIKSEINKSETFTIFAPDNAAFKAYLDNNNWTSINEIPLGTLTNIVQAHFSKSQMIIKYSEHGDLIPLLYSTKSIYLDLVSSSTPQVVLGNSQAKVTEQDLMQINGIVQRLDSVLSF